MFKRKLESSQYVFDQKIGGKFDYEVWNLNIFYLWKLYVYRLNFFSKSQIYTNCFSAKILKFSNFKIPLKGIYLTRYHPFMHFFYLDFIFEQWDNVQWGNCEMW